MPNERDVKIVKLLKQFRVLSRNQLEKLCFSHNKNPQVVVNRVMKRLHLEGKVIPVPRPKELCYLYMPNPTMIHPQSIKTRHFLAIAEFFIRIGQPKTYIVEPDLQCSYHPDVYMVYKEEQVCIEIQLTHISNKKMQKKIDEWVTAYEDKKHYAKKLWIVTDNFYKLTVPTGFGVEYHQWNLDKEKEIEL